MLGEPENQFSLTRAALSTRGAQKQIPISNSFQLSVHLAHLLYLKGQAAAEAQPSNQPQLNI